MVFESRGLKSSGSWVMRLVIIRCLEAQDQDSKQKTKTVMVKTKTVKVLSQDETVYWDFPSLTVGQETTWFWSDLDPVWVQEFFFFTYL